MKLKKGLLKIFACVAMAIALCLGVAACTAVKEYTLTFVTNGAAEISPITAVAEAEITPPANPEKQDYVFEGWYEQEDFSGSKVTIPDKMPERNVTYYAHFTALEKGTLTVDFDGVKDNVQHQLLTGTNVTGFLKDIDTSSDKADFVGWYVGDSPLKDTQKITSDGLTVKAVWEVGYTFNVYKEGADGYALDKSYTLSGTLGKIPELTQDYGGEGYVRSAKTEIPKLTLGENPINLYYDLATYTFTYVIDGNDSVNGIIQKDYKFNETVTIDGCDVQRENYRFIGWATEYGKAPDNRYRPAQKVVITSSVELYACWNRSYLNDNGDGVVWLNPLVTVSGAATLEMDGEVYEGEVNGVDLKFDVDGETLHARITDTDNFLFTYRDEYFGYYLRYDYTVSDYVPQMLHLDGYGTVTNNAIDTAGGLTANEYGKYALTEQGDFQFTLYNVTTGTPITDTDGNRQFYYFTLGEYAGSSEYITGSYIRQGLESGEFMEYSNGEFGYDALYLYGYGYAELYTYDIEEKEVVLYARGAYSGTADYESVLGEWRFTSDDGQTSFKFILNAVINNSDIYSVYIIFDETLYGNFTSADERATLHLDGYGGVSYISRDGIVLEGIAVVKDDFVTFRPYNEEGQSVGKIYFNLDRRTDTFTQNDVGFEIQDNVLVKYAGESAIIEIPDGITKISDNAFHYMYVDCTILSVTIPESVTEIGERAFENNRTLSRVYLKSATPCTLGGKAFDWPGGGFIIIVPDDSVQLYRSAEGWTNYSEYIFGEQEILNKPEFEVENGVLVRYNSKDVSGSLSLVIPDEVTEIAANVFRGMTNLISVDLNNVTKIGTNSFAQCTNLERITATNLEEIGESAFLGCYTLTTVNLPAIKVIGESAFSACYDLTRVIAGEDLEEIDRRAFSECAISYSVDASGQLVAVPGLLFVELAGNTLPDMGGEVFYGGTQGRIQVKNIAVALTCTENLTWKTYVGKLYIPSGEEKGIYYDIENLLTVVLDGRAIVYGMDVWLYAVDGDAIYFYVFEDDTCSEIQGTIKDGVITLQQDKVKICYVKEGAKLTYTDNADNELVVTLGGGNENTIKYVAAAAYNGTAVQLNVESRKVHFDLDGYNYALTLYTDYTFSAKKTVIPYTIHVAAEDGSALDITVAAYLSVTGTFKDINGEERTAQTAGSWYIKKQRDNVYEVIVIWRSDRYTVTVTVSGDTFTYEWKLQLITTSYEDAATGNGVIVYTNSSDEIVDIHLMIKEADGIKRDVSKNYELKDDGTYVFVVNETEDYFDETLQEVITQPSPYNGTYTVTINFEAETCEIIYKNILILEQEDNL